jgi:hypothetical protein
MGVVWLFGGRAAGIAGEVARRAGLDQMPEAAAEAYDGAGSVVKSAVGTMGGGISSAASKLQKQTPTALHSVTRIGRMRFPTMPERYLRAART